MSNNQTEKDMWILIALLICFAVGYLSGHYNAHIEAPTVTSELRQCYKENHFMRGILNASVPDRKANKRYHRVSVTAPHLRVQRNEIAWPRMKPKKIKHQTYQMNVDVPTALFDAVNAVRTNTWPEIFKAALENYLQEKRKAHIFKKT